MELKRLIDLVTGQASADYQEERKQKIQNPEHDIICDDGQGFIRPATHITEETFNIPGIVLQDIKDIESDLKKLLHEGKDCLISSKHYFHVRTPEVTTDDLTIIPMLENPKLISLGEALATAKFLIEQDLQGKGPLFEPNPEKDRNVNLGYCELDDNGAQVVKIVFIERVQSSRWVDGKQTYHIHAHKTPRFYKPNRHLLDF